MIRLSLSASDRAAVQALRRARALAPAERDRVEMVVLSDAGWSPPRIAAHLTCHPVTVRAVLRRFPSERLACLRRGRPGPAPDTARRAQVTAALDALLAQDRTWTAAQLAAALRDQGIALSTRQTRKYLGRLGAHWRRTARTLRHKQDPDRVAQAAADLDDLKKSCYRRDPPDVSRCVWLRSVPAGVLLLGAGGGAQTHPVRESPRPARERAGRPR